MARKKYEFRPDPTGYDVAGKLVLTRLQRQALLKWLLYSLLCLAGLILQDSLLSRLQFWGGRVELAPVLILLICILEGCENGSRFALVASMLYVFSGTAQGRYCILYLTACAVLATAFRQRYLRRSVGSELVCLAGAMAVYELAVFATGLFLELTYPGRWSAFAMTAVFSTLAGGLLYKVVRAVGTIGGALWKE